MDLTNNNFLASIIESPAFKALKQDNLSKMKRSERRRKEQDLKKMERAAKSLTPEQMTIMDRFVTKATNEQIAEFGEAIDRSITAYLILNNPEKTWDEIVSMQDDFADLMYEDVKKYRKLLEEDTKGDLTMGKKCLEKFEGKVRERATQLIETGVGQNDAIEMLRYEFPKLSKSMISNGFKKVKSELEPPKKEDTQEEKIKKTLDECEDEKMRNGLKYIFDDERKTLEHTTKAEECIVKEDKIIKPKNAEIKRENIVADKPEEPIKTEKKKSKLKVLNWIKNVEGENGNYIVSVDGVKLQNHKDSKVFNTLNDVDKCYKEELDKLNAYFDEIKEVFTLME